MRYLGMLVWVGACSSPQSTPADAQALDAKPIDAPPDGFDACANAPYAGCVLNGLAGQPFDGVTVWTVTGTVDNMPLMETVYIHRQGCGLTITSSGSGTSYVADSAGSLTVMDTRASYSASGATPHPYTYQTAICVDDGSNALHFTSHWQRTMPMLDQMIDAVLTH